VQKQNTGTKVQILTPVRSSGAQPAQGVAENRKKNMLSGGKKMMQKYKN
jgi:hypothetical protein